MGWAPLAVITATSAFATARLPDWARMWSLTLSLYAGFKWFLTPGPILAARG